MRTGFILLMDERLEYLVSTESFAIVGGLGVNTYLVLPRECFLEFPTELL